MLLKKKKNGSPLSHNFKFLIQKGRNVQEWSAHKSKINFFLAVNWSSNKIGKYGSQAEQWKCFL